MDEHETISFGTLRREVLARTAQEACNIAINDGGDWEFPYDGTLDIFEDSDYEDLQEHGSIECYVSPDKYRDPQRFEVEVTRYGTDGDNWRVIQSVKRLGISEDK